jgi:hypothetical protein
MHPIQDLFLEIFSYALQFDMQFYMHSYGQKFYSCKKWVLQKPGLTLEASPAGSPSHSSARPSCPTCTAQHSQAKSHQPYFPYRTLPDVPDSVAVNPTR